VRKLLGALLLLLPLASHAWWNDEWEYRKEIKLDTTAAGADIPGTVTDVPVLIRLSLGNFGYFADTKPDGSDLRFVAADDKTPLKFHVERYDATNQMAFLWVKIPRVAGAVATDKVYLYYGNKKAPAGADLPGTYDAQQTLVYHFDSQSKMPTDATAYGNNPTGTTAEQTAASVVGSGLSLTGTTALTVPATSSLRYVPKDGATLSTWVKIEGPQNDAYVLAFEDQNNVLAVGIKGDKPFVQAGAIASPTTVTAADTLAISQWHLLTLTVSQGRALLYLDGKETGNGNVDVKEIAGTFTVGGSASNNHVFVGEVDEVQVAKIARNPDYIKLAARSQGQEAPLVVYGEDAQREGQKVSYFKVTLQNVTPDGWVVIVILLVMFLIAVMVIIGKAIYLAKVSGANKEFLKEFEKLRGDPTVLDRDEKEDGDDALDESPFMPHVNEGENRYRMSTIYRLYHHGVQEMHGRVGLKSAGSRAVTTLSPQAIAAIRAVMDATLVRMTQRLQSQMVLLTIAISGGPFLGLLGTVVGVMITFAAIAASGDVNVNSIAPGISASLAATVAGLAVAIPALFAYNWLNIRIKEVNADMHVFVDEFVTRIAEHYS